MQHSEEKAYAKINLILNVLGKRPDGFHEVETVMQALDFYDRVRVGWEPGEVGLRGSLYRCEEHPMELSIEIRTNSPALSTESDNLVYKAALLMHETFHSDCVDRITIDIDKKLPIAAGLAGGSADAAAVMKGLAELWGIWDEKQDEIAEVSGKIGSDVPFCVLVQAGKTACIATGTGTQLQPTAPIDCKVLITTPRFSVPTKDVYGGLTEEDYQHRFDTAAFLGHAQSGNWKDATPHMGNHLQASTLRLFPETEKSIEWVRAQKNPMAVQVSGSGPTVFGLYPHGSELERMCVHHGPNPDTFFVSTLL